jgi:hypothetical protein
MAIARKKRIKDLEKKGSTLKTSTKKSTKNAANTLATKSKAEAAPLAAKPSTTQAKDKFSEYVRAVLAKKRSFEILSRGKTVAILGPIGSLPAGMKAETSVPLSDYTLGKRTFPNVIHHGPFTLLRNNTEVAVLYPPRPTDASRIQNILHDLVELKLLDLAKRQMKTDTERQKEELQAELELFREKLEKEKERIVGIRRKAEGMARERIRVLRAQGNSADADRFESSLNEIVINDGNL